ncbi:MAG: helix-turn-helix transcriptional regulator [Clostridiales bacterium]|nr:helix-turn-helix transcriptional regulator [Clostridiales bacterium]
MKLNDIQPFVRQAVICKLHSGLYTGKKIKTRDCRLFYILHGNGEMLIEGKRYTLKANSVILFQTGTEYVWQSSDVRYIAINFDYTQDYSHIKRTFSPINAEIFPKDNFSQKIIFDDAQELNGEIVLFNCHDSATKITNLAVEINTAGEFKDELLSSLLKSIIISIIRQKRERLCSGDTKGSIITRQIIDYVQQNYSNHITNKDLSERFFFNPSYANRVFKAHTGFSIRTFIIDYRINQAMEILRTQNAIISETAFLVGFSDIPHFIKTFKKHVGKTPTEYVKSNSI